MQFNVVFVEKGRLHYQHSRFKSTNCGLMGEGIRMTKDPLEVNCLRCRRASLYKTARQRALAG